MRVYLATHYAQPQSIAAQLLGVRLEVKLASAWALKGRAIPPDDGPREEEALARFLKDRWGDRAWFSRQNGSFLFMDEESGYECYRMFCTRGSLLPIRVWLK